MALRLEPEGVSELERHAAWLQSRQNNLSPSDWDWSFLDYQRRAIANETDPEKSSGMIHCLRHCEATRDFYTGSIKQINPLVQFDPEPNHALTETKVELYKLSISFEAGGKKPIFIFDS